MITALMIPLSRWRARQWLAVTLLAFAFALFSPVNTVFAGDAAPVVAEDVSEFVIAAPYWTIITGLLLPIVIGLVTKASASSRFQAIVGILVAAVGAIVVRATTVDGAAVFDSALILDAALVYVPQIAAYLGFWKNLDLNQRLAPNAGLG